MKHLKNSVSGVALVIVLGFLVIISALAVAFFSSINTEMKAARNFAAGITTRQLADSSVQIIMGQIASATTRGIDTAGVGHEVWASQPGMIRVYGTNTGGTYTESASADAFFKLYSSDQMIVTTVGSNGGATLQTFTPQTDYLATWDQAPALWTDLNAPVIIHDPVSNLPTPRFPIIDPRAYAYATNPTAQDPWANDVEGFSYDSSTGGVDGIVGPKNTLGGDISQRLPMPVKWIYVLQDGTLTTPSTTGTTTADFSTAPANKQPTAQNPIVGRIAFWTDDETCKLNLNTAAGYSDRNVSQLSTPYQNQLSSYAGSYWDSPRFYTQFDYGIPITNPSDPNVGKPDPTQPGGGLALCQLLQFEFQRYPGHPATTSLAPVLDTLLTSEQIYDVVPRYTGRNLSNQLGSTQGGTVRVIVDPYAGLGNNPPVNPTTGAVALPNPAINNTLELQPKQDRLYANVDEFLYGAHSVGGVPNYLPGYTRSTNNLFTKISSNPYSPISPQAIDQLRFFVSAQGRSPELNVFGQPRISCWPVRAELPSETQSGLNIFDNLMVFCSTVGTSTASTSARPDTKTDNSQSQGIYRYIFTRRELATTGTLPVSPMRHTDAFLNSWTQYEFNTNYVPDWQLPAKGSLSRNTELLQNYLYGSAQNPGLTSRNLPGNGNSFSSKYADGDRQGILTEIFDYIRLANSQDTTFSIAPASPPVQTIKFAPNGYVPPSLPSYFTSTAGQAKGFGRMSTICEASVVFYYAGPVMNTDSTYVPVETIDGKNTPITGAAPNSGGYAKWDPAPNASTARYVKLDSTNKHPFGNYVRAFVLFSMFDPMQGYAPKSDPKDGDPKLTIEAAWVNDWTVNGTPLGFPTGAGSATTLYVAPGSVWGGRNYGGYEGFLHTLQGTGSTARPYKFAWAPNTPLTAADIGINWTPSATYGTKMPISGTMVNVPFLKGIVNGSVNQEYYPFQSKFNVNNMPVFPSWDPTKPIPTFSFSGGHVTVKLFYGGSTQNASVTPPLQSFDLFFPPGNGWPAPQGAPYVLNDSVKAALNTASPPQWVTQPLTPPTADVSTWLSIQASDTTNFGSSPTNASGTGQWQAGSASGTVGMQHFYWTGTGTFFSNMLEGIRVPMQTNFNGQANAMTSLQASWSFATRLAWVSVNGADSSDPHTNGSNVPANPANGSAVWSGDRWRCICQPGDTIRSLLYWDGNDNTGAKMSGTQKATTGGDLRIAALSSSVNQSEFQPHPDYNSAVSRACVLRGGDGNSNFPVGNVQPLTGMTTSGYNIRQTIGSPAPVLAVPGDSTHEASVGNHITLSNPNKMPLSRGFGNLPWGGGTNVSAGVNGVMRRDSGGNATAGKGQYAGDFDTGLGDFPDGPFCNKQDEGNVIFRYWDTNLQQFVYPIPYFTNTQSYQAPGNVFTSPSRQMPSPAMFGSLPSRPTNGVAGGGGGLGWTTLAFSPNTAGINHPGNAIEPKDHNLLDFFMMPVVEPYPISEPFSTAGKVNLNYRIVPFDYIRRSTALRGALYPLRVTAVQGSGFYSTYKTGTGSPAQPLTVNFRLRLDRDETIKSFDGFFDSSAGNPDGGFFKVASQVCERWLYPKDGANPPKYPGTPTAETPLMQNWWKQNGDLTGDNEREKPYVDLYPRICTKSNTFTVHMKVQTLRQTPGHPTTWIEGKDAVLGEYRGSTTIERYVDPSDPRFSPSNSGPIFNPDKQSVEPMYRFRVVVNRKFTP